MSVLQPFHTTLEHLLVHYVDVILEYVIRLLRVVVHRVGDGVPTRIQEVASPTHNGQVPVVELRHRVPAQAEEAAAFEPPLCEVEVHVHCHRDLFEIRERDNALDPSHRRRIVRRPRSHQGIHHPNLAEVGVSLVCQLAAGDNPDGGIWFRAKYILDVQVEFGISVGRINM